MNSSRRILVHGHRGARARRPENTLPAFEYAIDAGADFLELDVLVTKDLVVVVCHDPVIDEDVPIFNLALDQLRQYDFGGTSNPEFPNQELTPGARIPTLDEVFNLGTGNAVGFNVEIKIFEDQPALTPEPEPFVRLVLESIERHGMGSRVMVQSFDPRPLRVLRQLAPAIPRGALFEEPGDWMKIAREFEATVLCPWFRLVTPALVKQAHEAWLKVVPWTANGASEWAWLIEAGVDGIITDDPAALIAYI